MAKPYLTLISPLDKQVKRERKFHISALFGEEGISKDFSFSLRLSSPERLTDSEMDQLMGHVVTLSIGYLDHSDKMSCRYVNGIVYSLEDLGVERLPSVPDSWHYRLEIGSWLRKLSFIKDCRIFQKNGNTALQLINDLLREYELPPARSRIRGRQSRRDLVIQYNETVERFVMRLLREEHLLFYFQHSRDSHTMMITDDITTLPVLGQQTLGKQDAVQQFCRGETHLAIKAIEEASFAWERQPVKTVSRKIDSAKGLFCSYRYTGAFDSLERGEQRIKNQGRALISQKQPFQGESTIRGLRAGAFFELQAPSLPDQHGKRFLVKQLAVEATEQRFLNRFMALPSGVPCIPEERESERPLIRGPQTAIVVGEGDAGSVAVDDLGRIRVKFLWDRYAPPGSSHTSAYLRVAMPAAGSDRGILFNPRVGEHVLVGFEGGIPEKAYILGSTYAKHSSPPFAPNAKPFCSIIKNSHAARANQVVFDDNPGRESLKLVARRNMSLDAEQNTTVDVRKDMKVTARSLTITAKTGVDLKAGNEINNRSLATILNLAAATGIHTAGKNILNMAAGLVMQGAGGILTNLAGLLYANTSILGITQSAGAKVDNKSSLLLLNTGSSIINAAESLVNAKAGLAILNSAQTDTVNKGKTKKENITLMSNKEAAKFIVEGDTTVGSG